MMLRDLIHDLIDRVAYPMLDDEGLLATVIHEPYQAIAPGGWGEPGDRQYGSPIARKCVVRERQEKKLSLSGEEIMATHKLTFLGSVPVDHRDRITLPDGSQPVIAAVESAIDSDGNGYTTTVWMTVARTT